MTLKLPLVSSFPQSSLSHNYDYLFSDQQSPNIAMELYMLEMNDELKEMIVKYGPKISSSEPITIRSIPVISELEQKLFFTNLPSQLEVELENQVNAASKYVFGITEDQTKFLYPDNYSDLAKGSEKWSKVEIDFIEYEEDYLTSYYGDEDTIEILKLLGIDFSDENGNPLRCTRYLKRQAEVAAKGLKGHLPDITKMKDEDWQKKLEEDAKTFSAIKKK